MAADDTLCAEFVDWDLDTWTRDVIGLKQEKQLSAPQRRRFNLCRRKVTDDRSDEDLTHV